VLCRLGAHGRDMGLFTGSPSDIPADVYIVQMTDLMEIDEQGELTGGQVMQGDDLIRRGMVVRSRSRWGALSGGRSFRGKRGGGVEGTWERLAGRLAQWQVDLRRWAQLIRSEACITFASPRMCLVAIEI